ncbi:histidine kinase [Seonamhaeicola sp.]|uniref:sensor histidine kinase n=1 Tax=Seonamhaeicola sp. TaxID=1912245 RepID=UPI002637E3E5|nr:histidine kinase [Seonamhaeicola sp.]
MSLKVSQRIISILLNPYIVALLVSVAIIAGIPDSFSRYEVSLETKNYSNLLTSKVYHHDFDGDGLSERIEAQTNTLGNASFLYYHSNDDFVDQINFNSKWPFRPKKDTRNLSFSDINGNGHKEVFLITQRADSIFLNIIELFVDHGIELHNIFIDTIGKFNGEHKFWIGTSSIDLEKSSNGNEVVFGILTGFAANPRNIYKYNLEDNRIIKSPHLTNSLALKETYDLDADGRNEILLHGSAYGNAIESVYSKRSDYSTWLTVLDDDLSFLFEPVGFKGLGSTYCYEFKKGKASKVIALFRSRQYKKQTSKLLTLSIDGKIEGEALVPSGKQVLVKVNDTEFVIFNNDKGVFRVYDNNLKLIKEITTEPFRYAYLYDVNGDETKEWLVMHNDYKHVSIYTLNFKQPVTFELSGPEEARVNLGFREIRTNKRQLFFQKDKFLMYCDYRENPLYIYQYGIYIAIYFGILGLVFLILKGQSIREAKKQAIESEIAELQIKTIKNQVDPHFVFNAINTISEMTLADNKLEADNFICRFSDFMRDTLQNSDKIMTTLKEELEYTENFIKLQKIRHNNSFDYDISVDSAINTETKIPKHVLFTYVENAIKHGLTLNPIKGMLKIEVKKQKQGMLLTVEDNGVGLRKSKANNKHSTGSGLLIMEKIFDLYAKLNKKKIIHNMIELKDKVDNNKGVRVEIKILN